MVYFKNGIFNILILFYKGLSFFYIKIILVEILKVICIVLWGSSIKIIIELINFLFKCEK